jgi:hypothetical protein
VRDASTKPIAATVLPAPVACSNQKRRAAPASSTAASLAASSSASSAGSQSSGSSSGSSSPSISTSLLGHRCATVGAARDLELRGERDQRAGEGVDLVGVERRAVGQVGLLLGQQPLEAEHERVVAPPGDRRLLATVLDLLDRILQRHPAGGARRQSLSRVLPGQHEALAREFFGAREDVAWERRVSEGRACLSHVRRTGDGKRG